MIKIAFYGVGGLGHEVAVALRNGMVNDSEDWNLIGYFDDRDFSDAPEDRLMGRWLGNIDSLNSWDEPLGVLLCFGNPHTRMAVANKITNPYISFPNCIGKGTMIKDKDTFSIGKGNIIQGLCVMTTEIKLGDFNLLNGDIALGHNVEIGNSNVFMPGCKVSGEVKIGDNNLFGAMSFIKQNLRIGNNIVLSPLSALLTKPKDNSTYIGNPARIFKF